MNSILDESLVAEQNPISPDRVPVYKLLRKQPYSYPSKYSLCTKDRYCKFCDSCTPFVKGENIELAMRYIREDLSLQSRFRWMVNENCFSRCGSSFPGCDPNGAIEMRVLGDLGEFASYYAFRPESLIKKDIRVHPESRPIHRKLLDIFEDSGEKLLAEKILKAI